MNVDISMPRSKHGENGKPSDELLKLVADIVCREYEIVKNEVEERFLETEIVEKFIATEEKSLGLEKIKHLKQLSSIIGHFLSLLVSFLLFSQFFYIVIFFVSCLGRQEE